MKISSIFLSTDKNYTSDRDSKKHLLNLAHQGLNRVKDKIGFLPLNKVILTENTNFSSISFKDYTIKINPLVVKDLLESIDGVLLFEALIEYSAASYLFHPYHLKRIFFEKYALEGKKNADLIRNLYDEVNKVLRMLVLLGDRSRLNELFKLYEVKNEAEFIIRLFYEDLSGLDFGFFEEEVDDQFLVAVQKLKQLNFLKMNPDSKEIEFVRKSDQENSKDLLEFYYILEPFLKENKVEGGELTSANEIEISSFEKEDLSETVKELFLTDKIDKEKIKNIFARSFNDFGSFFSDGLINEAPDKILNKLLYLSLLKKYQIKINKLPLIPKKGFFYGRHEKYEVGDNLADLDIFNSFGGKILPGLSNKWVKEEIRYHKHEVCIPDLILMLDDSSSMPDPVADISNAVLGSLAVSLQYLKNSAKVSIVKFSDRTKINNFSNNFDEIAAELLSYKSGFDTYLDTKEIEKLFEVKNSACDIIIITDGLLKNITEAIECISSFPYLKRFYFILIGKKNNLLLSDYLEKKKIKFIFIDHKEDIASIILESVNESKNNSY